MDTLQKKEIKVYVPVRVAFDETGRMFPRAIQWEDGQVYEIAECSTLNTYKRLCC